MRVICSFQPPVQTKEGTISFQSNFFSSPCLDPGHGTMQWQPFSRHDSLFACLQPVEAQLTLEQHQEQRHNPAPPLPATPTGHLNRYFRIVAISCACFCYRNLESCIAYNMDYTLSFSNALHMPSQSYLFTKL